MRFDFNNGSRLYIAYNDFDEYAYQLIFSFEPLDRIRFNAMDKSWNVDEPPHHFHPRFDEKGYNSPMLGIPSEYFPLFIIILNLIIPESILAFVLLKNPFHAFIGYFRTNIVFIIINQNKRPFTSIF